MTSYPLFFSQSGFIQELDGGDDHRQAEPAYEYIEDTSDITQREGTL